MSQRDAVEVDEVDEEFEGCQEIDDLGFTCGAEADENGYCEVHGQLGEDPDLARDLREGR